MDGGDDMALARGVACHLGSMSVRSRWAHDVGRRKRNRCGQSQGS